MSSTSSATWLMPKSRGLTESLTRAPRRRRLPAGGAGLRRRLTPLAARCLPGPYYPYCSLRPRTASGARGTRGQMRLTQGVSRQDEVDVAELVPEITVSERSAVRAFAKLRAGDCVEQLQVRRLGLVPAGE